MRAFVKQCGGTEPDPNAPKKGVPRTPKTTYEKTHELVQERLSLVEMAHTRELTSETILSHLERLLADKKLSPDDIAYLLPDTEGLPEQFAEIEAIAKKEDTWNVGPLFRALAGKYTYEELRFARLFLQNTTGSKTV